MIDFQVPLAGLQSAADRLDRAASRIARAADPSSTPTDTVDLSAEFVQLLQARNETAINVKVAQTFDDIQQSLLNILA